MSKIKRILTTVAFIPLIGMMAPQDAAATPISGEIFFTGSAALTGPGTPTAGTATGIDFSNPITIIETISTGAYDSLGAATMATFTDLTGGNSFGGVGTVGDFAVTPLWTFDYGPLTYSFALTSVIFNGMAGSGRVVEGEGIATITLIGGGDAGFEATTGFWQLSTSGRGTNVSFSANTAVPDGGTSVTLFGLALLGIGAVRRRFTA